MRRPPGRPSHVASDGGRNHRRRRGKTREVKGGAAGAPFTRGVRWTEKSGGRPRKAREDRGGEERGGRFCRGVIGGGFRRFPGVGCGAWTNRRSATRRRRTA